MFGKPKVLTPAQMEEIRTKDFFDMILPGSVKFLSDHYVVGDSYRSVWVIREYPPSTEEQAILSQLADRSGVTLRIYHRLLESMEQRKIIQNATRRNKLKSGGTDVNETIEAEGNLQDVIELLANLRKNKEPLLHCSVYTMIFATKVRSSSGVSSVMSVNFLALAMKFLALAMLLRSFSRRSSVAGMASASCAFSLEYASDSKRNCSLLTRPKALSSYIRLNTTSSSPSRFRIVDNSRSNPRISFATSVDCFC